MKLIQTNRSRVKHLPPAFGHSPSPRSRRGPRRGGNDSYKPPGAPSTLPNLGKKLKSIIRNQNFDRQNRNSSLIILMNPFEGSSRVDFFIAYCMSTSSKRDLNAKSGRQNVAWSPRSQAPEMKMAPFGASRKKEAPKPAEYLDKVQLPWQALILAGSDTVDGKQIRP